MLGCALLHCPSLDGTPSRPVDCVICRHGAPNRRGHNGLHLLHICLGVDLLGPCAIAGLLTGTTAVKEHKEKLHTMLSQRHKGLYKSRESGENWHAVARRAPLERSMGGPGLCSALGLGFCVPLEEQAEYSAVRTRWMV